MPIDPAFLSSTQQVASSGTRSGTSAKVYAVTHCNGHNVLALDKAPKLGFHTDAVVLITMLPCMPACDAGRRLLHTVILRYNLSSTDRPPHTSTHARTHVHISQRPYEIITAKLCNPYQHCSRLRYSVHHVDRCDLSGAVMLVTLGCLPSPGGSKSRPGVHLFGFNWSLDHWTGHKMTAEKRAVDGLVAAGVVTVHATPCNGAILYLPWSTRDSCLECSRPALEWVLKRVDCCHRLRYAVRLST